MSGFRKVHAFLVDVFRLGSSRVLQLEMRDSFPPVCAPRAPSAAPKPSGVHLTLNWYSWHSVKAASAIVSPSLSHPTSIDFGTAWWSADSALPSSRPRSQPQATAADGDGMDSSTETSPLATLIICCLVAGWFCASYDDRLTWQEADANPTSQYQLFITFECSGNYS